MRTFNACCEGLFQLDHKASITQLLKHAELPWWFHVVALYKEGRLSPKHDQNQKSSEWNVVTQPKQSRSCQWDGLKQGVCVPISGWSIDWPQYPGRSLGVRTNLPKPTTCHESHTTHFLVFSHNTLMISYDLLWSLMSYNIWCHSDVPVPRLCRDVQAILHLRSDVAIFTRRPPYHNIISVLESEPRPASTRVWPSVECDDQSKLTQKSSEIHVHPRAMIWVWAEIGPL